MFSFLKKKEAPLTFKKRVEIFWALFRERDNELKRGIESKSAEVTVDIINLILEKSGLSMAFQMGFNGEKFEFFFSPEGNKDVQFLTRCIIDMCPDMPGWLFYSSKQASSIEKLTGMKIQISEQAAIVSEELFIYPVLDEKTKKFDIQVYNDSFKDLPEKDCVFISFLLLDEALGEYGTELFVGAIDIAKQRRPGDIDLLTFRNRVEGYKTEIEFDSETTPDQMYSIYQTEPEEKTDYALREDVFIISTSNVQTFNNYLKENALAKYGASYIFIVISMSNFDMDTYLDEREALSDQIDLEMQNSNDGFVVGYATGRVNCYIDLIIFDDQNSINTLKATLQKNYPKLHGSIHYVEKEKKDESFSF